MISNISSKRYSGFRRSASLLELQDLGGSLFRLQNGKATLQASEFEANGVKFMASGLDLNGKTITGLQEPQTDSAPATKAFVERLFSDSVNEIDRKESVMVSLIYPFQTYGWNMNFSNGTFTFVNEEDAAVMPSLQGVVLALGDRVGVFGEGLDVHSPSARNGIYIVEKDQDLKFQLVRAPDANIPSSKLVNGATIEDSVNLTAGLTVMTDGGENQGKGFVLLTSTSGNFNLNVTPMIFSVYESPFQPSQGDGILFSTQDGRTYISVKPSSSISVSSSGTSVKLAQAGGLDSTASGLAIAMGNGLKISNDLLTVNAQAPLEVGSGGISLSFGSTMTAPSGILNLKISRGFTTSASGVEPKLSDEMTFGAAGEVAVKIQAPLTKSTDGIGLALGSGLTVQNGALTVVEPDRPRNTTVNGVTEKEVRYNQTTNSSTVRSVLTDGIGVPDVEPNAMGIVAVELWCSITSGTLAGKRAWYTMKVPFWTDSADIHYVMYNGAVNDDLSVVRDSEDWIPPKPVILDDGTLNFSLTVCSPEDGSLTSWGGKAIFTYK